MAIDFTDRIKSFTLQNSLENCEISGNIEVAGYLAKEEISPRSVIDIHYGHAEDTTFLRARVIPSNFTKEPPWITGRATTKIDVMSLFKDARKYIVRTGYLENVYTTEILEMLVKDYLGLEEGWYDFSAIINPYKFKRLRIEEMSLAEAMIKLADIEWCYLVWHDGVLKAVPRETNQVYEMDFNSIWDIQITAEGDLEQVQSLKIIGGEMKREDFEEDVEVGNFTIKQEDFWQVYSDKWYFYIDLLKQPCDKLKIEADDETYKYIVVGIEGAKAKVMAIRQIPDTEPENDVHITLKGRVYKIGRYEIIVRDTENTLATGEDIYENEFFEDEMRMIMWGLTELKIRQEYEWIEFTTYHDYVPETGQSVLYTGKLIKFKDCPDELKDKEIRIREIETYYNCDDGRLTEKVRGTFVIPQE